MDRKDLEIHESPAVIKHLEFLQDIISRMAANSATCKKWTLTIVTGVIAFHYANGLPIVFSIIPVVFFFIFDSLYLGLERRFRDLYLDFVRKLKNGELQKEDVYNLKSDFNSDFYYQCICYGARSYLNLGFYVTMLIYTTVFCIALW